MNLEKISTPQKNLIQKIRKMKKKMSNNNKNDKNRDFEKYVTPSGEESQYL